MVTLEEPRPFGPFDQVFMDAYAEMFYQHTEPQIMHSGAFEAAFGVGPIAMGDTLDATLDVVPRRCSRAATAPAEVTPRGPVPLRYSMTISNGMLPRVALEYGQAAWVSSTSLAPRGALQVLGQLDAHDDADAEAAVGGVLADADLGGHRDILDVELQLTGDRAHGAGEAGRVPGGEELLGVGALAVAAEGRAGTPAAGRAGRRS